MVIFLNKKLVGQLANRDFISRRSTGGKRCQFSLFQLLGFRFTVTRSARVSSVVGAMAALQPPAGGHLSSQPVSPTFQSKSFLQTPNFWCNFMFFLLLFLVSIFSFLFVQCQFYSFFSFQFLVLFLFLSFYHGIS